MTAKTVWADVELAKVSEAPPWPVQSCGSAPADAGKAFVFLVLKEGRKENEYQLTEHSLKKCQDLA